MMRLTEKELADRWGISVRTCQKWRRIGMGPAFIVIGQHTVLYREEDVRAYERARMQGGEELPEPDGWRNAMKRAAAVLTKVSRWKHVKPEARETIVGIRDEITELLEEA